MHTRHLLMAPADDGGSSGGGAAPDRGDTLAPTPDTSTADAAAAAQAAKDAADALAAQKLIDDAAGAKPDGEGDGTVRDPATGKFAKKDPPADDQRIPKARFDEQVGKERQGREAAEGRIRELEARLAETATVADMSKVEEEITALELKRDGLLIDGDSAAAAAVSKEIRFKERQIVASSTEAVTAKAREQAREEMRLDIAVERLELQHDELNVNHPSYDKGLVEMVLALQRHKIQNGLSPSKALEAATADVMKLKGDGGVPKKDEPVEGLGGAERPSSKPDPVAARKAEQVAANLAASAAQPASTVNAGKDSDLGNKIGAPNSSGMTEAEFDALPEASKAKMRGDYL